MSITLICRSVDVEVACNVGGPPETNWVNFTIDCPALEAWLSAQKGNKYSSREIVGYVTEALAAGKE